MKQLVQTELLACFLSSSSFLWLLGESGPPGLVLGPMAGPGWVLLLSLLLMPLLSEWQWHPAPWHMLGPWWPTAVGIVVRTIGVSGWSMKFARCRWTGEEETEDTQDPICLRPSTPARRPLAWPPAALELLCDPEPPLHLRSGKATTSQGQSPAALPYLLASPLRRWPFSADPWWTPEEDPKALSFSRPGGKLVKRKSCWEIGIVVERGTIVSIHPYHRDWGGLGLGRNS